MRQVVFSQFAHLVLYATLAQCVFACSADSDHGPPIGAPTGPSGPVIAEGGGSFSGAGRAEQAGASATPGRPSDGGNAGSFGTPGIGGASQFGGGSGGTGSTGNDPFGIGGRASDQFGIAGALIPTSGSSSF